MLPRLLRFHARSAQALVEADSLLLRDPREDRYEQVAHGARGVCPGFPDAHERNACRIQALHDARDLGDSETREAVKGPDHEDAEAPRVRVAQEALKLGPLGRSA